MKKLFLLFLFIFAFAVPVNAFNPLMVCTGAVASGGTCTIGSGDNWVNADHADYWNTTTTANYNFQEVKNDGGSKGVCKIILYLRNPSGEDETASISLKDATNTTTYGTSDTVTITGHTNARYTFIFSSVAVATDFNVVFNSSFITINIECANGGDNDKYFGGTDYKATTGGSERNQDWAMEIWYDQ